MEKNSSVPAPVEGLKLYLEQAQDRIAAVAPKHLTPERLVRLAMLAVSRNPRLLDCSRESILRALMDATSLGLEPGVPGLSHGWIVPFKGEATFMPGAQGLVDVAARAGVMIDPQVVYEKDEFRLELGMNPTCVHKPYLDGERGALRCAYARIEQDGRTKVEWMTKTDILNIRDRSKAWQDKGKESPWGTDEAEMWRKTMARRACKYVRKSPELSKAMELEAEDYDFDKGVDPDWRPKPLAEMPWVRIPEPKPPAPTPQNGAQPAAESEPPAPKAETPPPAEPKSPPKDDKKSLAYHNYTPEQPFEVAWDIHNGISAADKAVWGKSIGQLLTDLTDGSLMGHWSVAHDMIRKDGRVEKAVAMLKGAAVVLASRGKGERVLFLDKDEEAKQ